MLERRVSTISPIKTMFRYLYQVVVHSCGLNESIWPGWGPADDQSTSDFDLTIEQRSRVKLYIPSLILAASRKDENTPEVIFKYGFRVN